MKQIRILYDKYFDFSGNKLTLGGIQTYITDLSELCHSLGYKVTIYQMGDSDKTASLENCEIRQVIIKHADYQGFVNKVSLLIDSNDLVIFATDMIIPRKNPFTNSLAIQHGICWDMPRSQARATILMHLIKAYRNYKISSRIKSVKSLVCVDYNFINWLRAQSDSIGTKLIGIPNYTKISEPIVKPQDKINIIFARRLWWYRGTRIFTNAIIPILESHDNITVTVAGEGPDLEYMHSKLDRYKNVSFISYESSESLSIHADKHIAIVPTVGSEGTSLSLLEAMSAQCAVIASNVGGMTNIILDGYNGLLVNAGDEKDLQNAVESLLNDTTMMTEIANNAYHTVCKAFSHEKWEQKWTNVIKTAIHE